MVYWKKMGLFGPDGGISDENEGFRGPFDGRGAGMRAGRRGCRNPCGGGIQSVSASDITLLSNGDSVYVGGENVTSGSYWTTDANGNVTAYTGEGTPTDNYIHYDAGNNTLTLHNATIKEALEYGDNPPNSLIPGAAIAYSIRTAMRNDHPVGRFKHCRCFQSFQRCSCLFF